MTFCILMYITLIINSNHIISFFCRPKKSFLLWSVHFYSCKKKKSITLTACFFRFSSFQGLRRLDINFSGGERMQAWVCLPLEDEALMTQRSRIRSRDSSHDVWVQLQSRSGAQTDPSETKGTEEFLQRVIHLLYIHFLFTTFIYLTILPYTLLQDFYSLYIEQTAQWPWTHLQIVSDFHFHFNWFV